MRIPITPPNSFFRIRPWTALGVHSPDELHAINTSFVQNMIAKETNWNELMSEWCPFLWIIQDACRNHSESHVYVLRPNLRNIFGVDHLPKLYNYTRALLCVDFNDSVGKNKSNRLLTTADALFQHDSNN